MMGLYLKGNGQGGLLPLSADKSGFLVEGDAKGLAELTLSDGHPLLLSSINSDNLKAFVPNPQRVARRIPKIIALQPLNAYAELQVKGKKVRHEFYYGSTYLSQSSRVLLCPKERPPAS